MEKIFYIFLFTCRYIDDNRKLNERPNVSPRTVMKYSVAKEAELTDSSVDKLEMAIFL